MAHTGGKGEQEVDFCAVFESSPAPFLLLAADPPRFTILAVNNAYLAATLTERRGPRGIVGRALFDVFPDNPGDPGATGEANLRFSLEMVVRSKAPNAMAVQKYDIPLPDGHEGRFEERYWKPLNTPVMNDRGEVVQILHHADDVTEATKLAKQHASLVTLCAWSRTVKYNGDWVSFEEYMRQEFGLSTTHGISPEALEGLATPVEGESHA